MRLAPSDYCHDSQTNDDLVRYLSHDNPDRNVIHELEGGIAVVRISDDVAVKYGFGIQEDEARNQQRAFELISSEVIRIPRVYRFFSIEDNGYILMEYVEGRVLSSLADHDSYIQPMLNALDHFTQIQHDRPGPLGGGLARGLLWLYYDLISPTSVADIEGYYNARQLRKSQKMNITRYPPVFCHLDLAPRNILVLADGSLCLLDWASAGFYPRLFEICTLRLNARKQGDWNRKILQNLPDVDEDEEIQAQLLQRAYYLGQKYD